MIIAFNFVLQLIVGHTWFCDPIGTRLLVVVKVSGKVASRQVRDSPSVYDVEFRLTLLDSATARSPPRNVRPRLTSSSAAPKAIQRDQLASVAWDLIGYRESYRI